MSAPLVLVADDAPDQLQALTSVLTALDCRIRTASSGPEALDAAREEIPDLILLNVLMPGMDGLEVLRALKEDDRTRGIPIVLITPNGEAENLAAGLEAGASDFIPKPFDAAILLARVRTNLDLKRTRDHEKALSEELQTTLSEMKKLTGMIPICAHCKKVRNDQGYWLQVEEYISSHTEALFTHGLCPECVPVFFPEMEEAGTSPWRPESTPERSLNPPLPRILVVDDCPTDLQVLIQFLRLDYKFLVATNGAVALELARREKPDLILLDVFMPNMDGYEVCRRLKDDSRTCKIPVIFLTGQNEEIDAVAGLELGAVDYIAKPFSLPVVQARILAHLELKRYRDELAHNVVRDELTGLQNRRGFHEFLGLMWNQAIRDRIPIAMILVNVDWMKAYNRHYGRAAGDGCIQSLAAALKGLRRRNTDLLARYGGQEFACLLPGTAREDALVIAGMLKESIDGLAIPHAESPLLGRLTVSIGVAACQPRLGDDPSSLVEMASQALHRARQEGRNQVFG